MRKRSLTMAQLKDALVHNFGKEDADNAAALTEQIVLELAKNGVTPSEEVVARVYREVQRRRGQCGVSEGVRPDRAGR